MNKWKWIYQQLVKERDRMDAALAALRPLAGREKPQGGNVVAYLSQKHKQRGPISAAARKRMSIAQKARWSRTA